MSWFPDASGFVVGDCGNAGTNGFAGAGAGVEGVGFVGAGFVGAGFSGAFGAAAGD